MPKVLRIINRFNLGGPTYNAAYLTKYLAPDFETLLVGGIHQESEADSSFILENLGIKAQVLDSMKRDVSIRSDWDSYREIKRIINEFKPDIVHTHASKAGALGRYAAFSSGVPVTVHTFHGHVFHSYFNKFKTNFYLNLERYLAKRTSKIIAISELQKQELVNTFKIAPKEKFSVINLGFELDRFSKNREDLRKQFREDYGLKENEIAISIIGRLVPIKNHKLFLEMANELTTKHNNLRFFIVGDGESKEELINYCQSNNLSFSTNKNTKAAICFTSWIKNAEYALAGTDIVALTSLNEGTPVSLIEAQAAAKPIVTSNVGGVMDVVLHNKTAFVHNISDKEGMINSFERLVKSVELRHDMGKKGEDFVGNRFSATRLASDVRELYYALLEANER